MVLAAPAEATRLVASAIELVSRLQMEAQAG